MNKRSKLFCMSLVIFASTTQASNAATVSFTQLGSNGLFGSSQLRGDGDTLFFSPSDFSAAATDLGNIASTKTQSQTSLLINALAGFEIKTITLLESGSYNQSNIVDNSASSYGKVSVTGSINAVNNESPAASALTSAFSNPSPFAHTGEDDYPTWTATTAIDASSFHSKAITLTILDILKAKSLALGDDSFINKSYVGISVTTSAVPLPTAVWLFGAALFGFLSVSKQNKQL